MFHGYDTYERAPRLLDELVSCKSRALVRKIGFSLYKPEEAESLLDAGLPLDIVQVPYSLLDRRFERVFPRLKAYGTEIHVRSAYLQGLVFMAPESSRARASSPSAVGS